MTATELKELKKYVKKLIDRADERALRMVRAMLEADAEYEEDISCLTQRASEILQLGGGQGKDTVRTKK